MLYDLSRFFDGDDITYHLEGELDSESIPKVNNIKIINPIRYSGEIYKATNEYLINCTIKYRYETNCDRCLEPTNDESIAILSGRLEEYKGKINDENGLEEIVYYENNRLNLKEY